MGYEPTEAEIQAAIKRLAKQKENRKVYAERQKEKLAADPNLKAAKAEKSKAYRQRPEVKEKMGAKRKEYYTTHKDKLKAAHKKYTAHQKEVMAAIKAKAQEAGMTLDDFVAASV